LLRGAEISFYLNLCELLLKGKKRERGREIADVALEIRFSAREGKKEEKRDINFVTFYEMSRQGGTRKKKRQRREGATD